MSGGQFDPALVKGKVLVLQFWASWCPFCARQNPHVETLYHAHRSRGLDVLAVSIDKTREAAIAYLQSHGYTFPAAMINPAYQRIFRLRRGLPQTNVIGRDGKLALVEMGEMFEEDIRNVASCFDGPARRPPRPSACALFTANQRPDPLVGEDFEQQRMFDPAVDDVHTRHP